MNLLKRQIFAIIDDRSRTGHRLNSAFNTLIVALILLSILAVMLESFPDLSNRHAAWFYAFEVMTVSVFTFEFLARLWTADLAYPEKRPVAARFRYLLSPLALIDLLSILPFYAEIVLSMLLSWGYLLIDLRFLRAFRLLRLLRILKLNRYSASLKMVQEVVRSKREDLAIAIVLCAILLIVSATVMYHIEHEAQPEAFPNIPATLWWAVATLTTVGYGDVYPITPLGKFASGVIALLGIGLIALPTGIISAGFYEKITERQREKKPEAPPTVPLADACCPHCGKPLRLHKVENDDAS